MWACETRKNKILTRYNILNIDLVDHSQTLFKVILSLWIMWVLHCIGCAVRVSFPQRARTQTYEECPIYGGNNQTKSVSQITISKDRCSFPVYSSRECRSILGNTIHPPTHGTHKSCPAFQWSSPDWHLKNLLNNMLGSSLNVFRGSKFSQWCILEKNTLLDRLTVLTVSACVSTNACLAVTHWI